MFFCLVYSKGLALWPDERVKFNSQTKPSPDRLEQFCQTQTETSEETDLQKDSHSGRQWWTSLATARDGDTVQQSMETKAMPVQHARLNSTFKLNHCLNSNDNKNANSHVKYTQFTNFTVSICCHTYNIYSKIFNNEYFLDLNIKNILKLLKNN